MLDRGRHGKCSVDLSSWAGDGVAWFSTYDRRGLVPHARDVSPQRTSQRHRRQPIARALPDRIPGCRRRRGTLCPRPGHPPAPRPLRAVGMRAAGSRAGRRGGAARGRDSAPRARPAGQVGRPPARRARAPAAHERFDVLHAHKFGSNLWGTLGRCVGSRADRPRAHLDVRGRSAAGVARRPGHRPSGHTFHRRFASRCGADGQVEHVPAGKVSSSPRCGSRGCRPRTDDGGRRRSCGPNWGCRTTRR